MINEISCKKITAAVEELCIKANKQLPDDIINKISNAKNYESCDLARSVLCDLEKNIAAASEYNLPVCQDTGMAVVFLEIGQDVHFTDGFINDAINEGVRSGYEKGLLRK